jgi:ADP-ribosylglycohydrolase
MTQATSKSPKARALLSLDGLSVGDAFGQRFFSPNEFVTQGRITNEDLPPAPWHYTDDTEMAISVVEILLRHGKIEQDDLADAFARRYAADSRRGYGGTAHRILREIGTGVPWQQAAGSAFDGMGSLGNGGAMRVAPLGAFFADDVDLLVEEARRCAEVTHSHAEGQAGAIAVAIAAAFAWMHRGQRTPRLVREMLDFVIDKTPDSQTRAGIIQAADLPRSYAVDSAVGVLENGTALSAPDTVPFCLWCVAKHFDNFTGAMWTTVSAGGDRDTNAAIVGGIIALSAADEAIPPKWIASREQLPKHLADHAR